MREIEQVRNTEEYMRIENEKDKAEYILKELIKENNLEKLRKIFQDSITSQGDSAGQ